MLSCLMTAVAWADGNRGSATNVFWNRFNGGSAQHQDELARKENRQQQRQINQAEKQAERQAEKQANKNSLLDRCKDGTHNGERACGIVDSSQKNRMTPDEKRALRRQIKDASNQIYTPAR